MKLAIITILFLVLAPSVYGQNVSIDASMLQQRVELFFSSREGSFVEGATFEVPILLDTRGLNINGIEVRLNFDKDKLQIIKPSGGKSIIGVWVEPPKYDNTNGTASYVGVVPNGIVTDAGLKGTITFKALRTGRAVVSINSNSNILLNDGLGTKTVVGLGRAEYNIIPKGPEGVNIFSETHPIQSDWYNNNSPIIFWEKLEGVEGFSFVLDDKPATIPDNTIDTRDNSVSFENLPDGLWYFHIKAFKRGVGGAVGHFLIRIDTTPPADFKPEANYLLAATALIDRVLISFFTTDNLSGIDYYEVGVINKNEAVTASPVFVQAESPFQVPLNKGDRLEVLVRAIDKAKNVRDVSISVEKPFIVIAFIKQYLVYILGILFTISFLSFLSHYLFGHHIISNLRRFRAMIKKENEGGNSNNPNQQNFN
jgi:hypothetical protein